MPLYGKIVVIKRTGADGYNFPLTSSSCLFGRKTDCDIRIQLPHVSKEHCKLEVNENNEVILTNLSEVNRTHLNGNVVLHSERLKHHDVFTVIDRSFRFEYPLDSVHNTSPRKRRSSSSLRNETLQVLHVQQEVDDCSQSSGNDHRSTSGCKSDEILEAPTKSTKATPNEKGDSAPKPARKRSSSKILNNEQPADEEHTSPFSKLYEMFKHEVTKPIPVKPNKENTDISVKESITDLTEEASVVEKKSDAMVSQFGKNSQTSPSTIRVSGRRSKVKLEEGKMKKDNTCEKVNKLESLLVEDDASAKPTDINSAKQNNISEKLNKFTDNPSFGANATPLTSFEVGVKGKDQNHLPPKRTPNIKRKSQNFTTCNSITVDEAIKKIHENLDFSMEKGIGMKTVEMEHLPAHGDKERAETPKKRSRSSLRNNKTVQPPEIQLDQVESTNVTEPSVAQAVDMKQPAAHGDKKRSETPKKRGRSSLHNQNVQRTEIETDQVDSTNASEPTVSQAVNMKQPSTYGDKEKAETPKKRGRSSMHNNKTIQPPEIQPDQVVSINVSEPSVAKSKDISIDLKGAPAHGDKEKAETPNKRGRSSLNVKAIQPPEIQPDQVVSINVSEPSVAKSKDISIDLKGAPAHGGKEKAETPNKRGRSSLSVKAIQPSESQADQVESINVSKLSVAKPPASTKPKRHTTPSSLRVRNNRREGNCPTEAECLDKTCTSNSPHRFLTSEQTEKVVRGDHKSPMNTTTEQLGQFSAADVGFNLNCSSKESSSSPGAILHSSKKRRSANEENAYAPIFKRKRVSFGANLSPELFDKRMPPSSPLRKGGTPTRVSTPFRSTPHTVLKRASIIGIHSCTIQEFNEQTEHDQISPRRSRTPSEDSSRQTKKSPAKISSPVKESALTTAKKSPVKGSPLVKTPMSSKIAPLSTTIPSLSSSKKSSVPRSPSQSKSPSSITKKSSDVKALPTSSPRQSVANKLPSSIDERSFDSSPRTRGRFSISHVVTPSLNRSKSPCFTPTSSDVALFRKSQEKTGLMSSSGKSSSRKSTRRSGLLLAAVRARRQTGASAANLFAKKSWAQIVKEGVAKPQLQCARKKSAVVQKRTKNTVSLKVTPVHSVKGHFSTGHAASPATIVIGKSQVTTIKPTGQVPRVIRTVSLRRKDYEMDESLSGMAEMFSTPTNENVSTQPVCLTSDIVDNSQTALANPIAQKSFDESIIKTPEETGVMTVSPLSTPGQSSGKYSNSVSRLLRCRVDFSSGINDCYKNITKVKGKPVEDMVGVKRIMKTPKVKGKPVEGMVGVKRIMKTPKVKGKPVEDMVGVKRIMKTPKVKGKPVKDMVGVKRIMKTPKVKGKPVEGMVGVKRIMKTPKVKGKPVEDMVGVKRIMKTPKVKGQPVEDMVGIKRIMRSPRVKSQPVEDMVGIKRIMRSPRVKSQPVEDMVGIKRIMRSPRVKSQPVEDMVGIKRIMKTPRVKGKPVENFAGLPKLMTETKQKAESPGVNYDGIKNLFHTVKEIESCDKTSLDEMFSAAIKTEESPDSKLQPSLQRSANKEATNKLPTSPENMNSVRQITETTENKLSQVVEHHNDLQSTKKKSSSQTCDNSSLTSDVKVSRKEQIQTERVTSPSSQELQMLQSEQFETSHMFETKSVDYLESQTGESKDGQAVLNKLILPARRSLKGRKETNKIGSKECLMTMNATPNKSGCLVECIEEVSKMVSTRKSLAKKESNDVDVQMSVALNKTTPDEKESPQESIKEVTVLKPQARRLLKEKDEIQPIESEELSTSIKRKKVHSLITDEKISLRSNKAMPGKKESPREQIEEINVLKSQARRLLKEKNEIPQVESKQLSASTKGKQICNNQDVDVKMSLRSNNTTPGKGDALLDQIEEVTVLNGKNEIQNILNVQLKELPSNNATPIRNDCPCKDEELNELFSPLIQSLRGKKIVQNVNSTEDKTEAQNIQDNEVTDPSTSAKTYRRDKRQIPVLQVEEMVHKNSRKRLQRRKVETEIIQVTELKNSAIAMTSKDEKETQCIQNEKLDNSPLNLAMHETSNVQNVELTMTKNECASSKTSVNGKEVKDLPVEDPEVLISKGRSQRRKNSNVEEPEGQKQLGTTDGYTRRRGTRCTRAEILKDSNVLQDNLRNEEVVDKENGVNSANLKLLEKDLACSKSRSTRGKRGPQDFLLEEVGQESALAKKLRKEELDEALLKKNVHWDSNITSAKLDGTVEMLQDTFKRTELPVLERRSRRGKSAKEVNSQTSLESIKIPDKVVPERASNKVIADACVIPESPEQKGRPKRGKANVLCESKAFTKDKYENAKDEMSATRETSQHSESVLKPSPTSIRRALRGNTRQKVTQIEEENVKELPSRKSKRNLAAQKLITTNDEEQHVLVSGTSRKEELKMAMDSSKAKVRDVQAAKQTANKCESINEAAKAFELMSDAKKTDTVLSGECEIKENTRPKRGVRKGRSAKEIETKIEVENAVFEAAEQLNLSKTTSKEATQTEEGTQGKKSFDKKLHKPVTNVNNKTKNVKKDALSVEQAFSDEGPQIEEAVDPVLGKGGRGRVKRSTSAVISQEMSVNATGKKQVTVNSATESEKTKTARRGRNNDKETANMIVQVDKNELIDKRRRPNVEMRTNGAEVMHSRKDELEDDGKAQDPSFQLVESAKSARRVTRANKSCAPAAIEPISDQLVVSASLQPAPSCSSKRTLRGKRAITETTDLSPKKSKIETVTRNVRNQGRKIGKRDGSPKIELAAMPQPAKPMGRSTRSRK
ncbi:proliferation marker protein Ki-67-like [Hemiscyllium ocellatum]|uniref:proliferation marker protein Ki-67-like n=1 Tax=Hemiscyllium ocellatum TaxID=170820 RepID=UPI002966EDC6|nr:proliferation marker protein Ki-67-like [Hemiscyllium ocellatum]XP_060697944.1 proliferation marker protein Ki-67-like [Hemiscyllium ocellatum]XP_060697945.1 proliferation marker protein Ki-67-like [Hemiscyllium ocellatum]XP_060697946.1 proliferation marker protein Ki-67-like [Hemiscyllium ocellatum]